MNVLDQQSKARNLSNEEIQERKEIQSELWNWLRRRESYWAQNSRARWLKEGDKNTKFFHTLATMRKRKNSIESIPVGNTISDDPLIIKEEAVKFFQKIFKEDHHQRPTFQGLNFSTLTDFQGNQLTEKFSPEEIDAAVASCDGSKSSGPDGLNFNFVKSSWDVIKSDVYKIVMEFWESGRIPRGCNTSFIALIPKNDNPSGFKEYRPISMVGFVYKIITKILARRLQCVMDSLVGAHQSSFIKGRQILDGVFIVSELIDSC